jgi:hypothetical protein
MRNYLGALIHMTQPRDGHVLQHTTWRVHYDMVKRDVCDFMFTFLGYYTNSKDRAKYVRFFPERMTYAAWSYLEIEKFNERSYINQELSDKEFKDIRNKDDEMFPVTTQKIQLSDRRKNPSKRLYPRGIPLNTRFLHDLDAIVDRLALICM